MWIVTCASVLAHVVSAQSEDSLLIGVDHPKPKLLRPYIIGADEKLHGRWRCDNIFVTPAKSSHWRVDAADVIDCATFVANARQLKEVTYWEVDIYNAKMTIPLCNIHSVLLDANAGRFRTVMWNSTRRSCSDDSDKVLSRFFKIKYYFRAKDRLHFFDADGFAIMSFTLIGEP